MLRPTRTEIHEQERTSTEKPQLQRVVKGGQITVYTIRTNGGSAYR